MKGQAILKECEASGWKSHQPKLTEQEIARKGKKTRSIHSTPPVIKSGAKRYGLPADAKERRM
ncbi:MAG: hypothetical protein ACOC6S_01730 [Chloroflexota bacterium]